MFRFLRHPNRHTRHGPSQPESMPRQVQYGNHGEQRRNPGQGHTQQPGQIGAGGYGPRGPRWPGETVPAGGEGFMNAGLTVPPMGGPIFTGGMPWQQVTVVGATAQLHRITAGESMASVAATYGGPQASPYAVAAVNPQLPQDVNAPITPGVNVTVPPAHGSGYAPPGGSGGTGIGAGSSSVGQSHGTRARQIHQSQHTHNSGQGNNLPSPGHGGGHR